jgi:primary-amine oxidase
VSIHQPQLWEGKLIPPQASGVIYLTVNDSSIGQNALHQASHHLFVTKQKDSEARASDPYNLLDTQNPLVNFDSYFDGESLDQEDL